MEALENRVDAEGGTEAAKGRFALTWNIGQKAHQNQIKAETWTQPNHWPSISLSDGDEIGEENSLSDRIVEDAGVRVFLGSNQELARFLDSPSVSLC